MLTARQRLMRLLHPVYLLLNRLLGRHRTVLRNPGARPLRSLYELEVLLGNGGILPLSEFRGRKLLLVNTASDCIYTDQYKELQQLMAQYGDGLVVIAFPSNDFKEQEKGSDADIAGFCQVNYGVTFPVAHKAPVTRIEGQQPVFRWLTDKTLNGWNTTQPSWNFSKYLVNEEGVLTHYFDPAISPANHELIQAIHHG